MKSDPRKTITKNICPSCRGSGVSNASEFLVDEFNPEGYWDAPPCEQCMGDGLSSGVSNALDKIPYLENNLNTFKNLVSSILDRVNNCRKHIENDDDSSEVVDKVYSELIEILEAHHPDFNEPNV